MSEVLTALAAAGFTACAAAGVGSLACLGAREWLPGRRWVLRLLLGLGLLPFVLIAGHEIFGLRVGPVVGIAFGCAGLTVAAAQEWRWRAKNTPSLDLVFVLVLAVGLFFTSLAGLLGQVGFEGLDPWRHVFGVAWVADSGLLRQPDADFPLVQYVDAYPPLYDVLIALPAGLLGNVPAAAKGVAALLVAVAPLALWLLASSVWGDDRRAALATILYALLPNAVSRHIWGHSLAVILLLVGLAAALELRRDHRWAVAVAGAFGGVLLAAPSQGLKAGLFFLVMATVAWFVDRRWCLRLLVAGAAAVLVASVWLVPAASRHGFHPVQLVRAMQPPELRRSDDPLTALDPGQEKPLPWAAKPHDRLGFEDVLVFRPFSLLLRLTGEKSFGLVVAAGLGLPLLVLLAAGFAALTRAPPEPLRALVVLWCLVALLLALGAPLGVVFFPWRSWLLVAAFAAVLAADGAVLLTRARPGWLAAALVIAGGHALAACVFDLHHGLLLEQLARPPWLVVVVAAMTWLLIHGGGEGDRRQRWVIAGLVGAHIVVAAPVRAATLLDPVPPRVFFDRLEHRSYLELASQLPPGTRVWPLSGGLRFDILTGLGLECTPFRAQEIAVARACSRGQPPPPAEVVAWLRASGYEWLVLDPSFDELQRALGETQAASRSIQAFDSQPDLARQLSGRARADGEVGFVAWQVRVKDPHR